MALKIIWTPKAIEGVTRAMDYLEKDWSAKEILRLEQNIKFLTTRISKYPEICPPTMKYNNLRKGLVDKHNYIIYRVMLKERHIEIINFRGMKQRPKY